MQPTTPKSGNTQKYVTLANLLSGQIEAGILKPGARLPSMADLKEIYGASQPTAERAYALLEKDGLIIRKPYKGVYVADLGQTRRQCVLGISIPPSLHGHTYYERIVRGIQSVAREEQLELLFLHENSVVRWEKVDGVILAIQSRKVYESVPQGMPLVSLMQPLRNGASVVSDDRAAIHALVEHLVLLGHRRIAFLTAGLMRFKLADIFYPDITHRTRVDAYYEAMRAAGIEPETAWVRPLRDPREPMKRFEELGSDATLKWLAEDWRQLGCTAIMAHNDETAIGVIEELERAGLRVPQDVSVVGFDGLDIANYFRPRLTTVEVPLEEIGAQGARMLLEQVRTPVAALRANKDTRRLDLVSQLRVGESTGPPPQS